MKNYHSYKLIRSFAFTALILSLFTGGVFAFDKMQPGELIAKHLESIGTAEARAALKSATIVGTSKATFFGRGGGIAEGITILSSKGDKYMVAMKFNNPDYQFEKMGYDAEKFYVGFVSTGKRSVLGNFLLLNRSTFERGIMSGVLSTGWELLNFDDNDAKVKYSGTSKIDGKKCHQLEYNPRKGSDLSISLYFDPDTFRHVRTEYRRTISSRLGATVDTSSSQSETRYKLIEDYSNFSTESDLTLPHTYKLNLEILSGNGTVKYEWEMNLNKFAFNGEIDDKDFVVDSY